MSCSGADAALDLGRLAGLRLPDLLKSLSSPMTEMSSSTVESDVIDSSSSTSERSLSEDDSVAVEGSYSCLSGDDDRR